MSLLNFTKVTKDIFTDAFLKSHLLKKFIMENFIFCAVKVEKLEKIQVKVNLNNIVNTITMFKDILKVLLKVILEVLH